MRVEASAPSNIALIKYMGKDSQLGNLPANPSLSYTLENLRSFVVIEPSLSGQDEWAPLPGFEPIALSEKGRQKFLNHFSRLKAFWNISGSYKVLSANNFPSDCGLASSASSFAALTKATFNLAQLNQDVRVSDRELSGLSRQGSGSSCRSFFSPWAEWVHEGGEASDLNLHMEHAVIVVDGGVKSVSSSEAHVRVNSSLLWSGRPGRAKERMSLLKASLKSGDWATSYEVCWSEFWDMHALFETSQPSFGYMNEGTLKALGRLRQVWAEKKDGPLITMDAGPNVHLLLRPDQVRAANLWLDGFKAIRSWSE